MEGLHTYLDRIIEAAAHAGIAHASEKLICMKEISMTAASLLKDGSQDILRRFSGALRRLHRGFQEFLRRFSGGSQEVLRRFLRGFQKILRWFLEDSQKVLNRMSGG